MDLQNLDRNREKKNKSGEEKECIIGTFISHSKGFGFVEAEDREEDLYISEPFVNGAFHKDLVQVELLPQNRGKKQEAAVVKIVERGIKTLVGTFDKTSAGFGFVIPDQEKIGTDIFVSAEHSKGAMDGHKVVVELTAYGDDRHKPEGKIVEILGHIQDPGVDILSVIKGFELPAAFGDRVMHQAERVPEEVLESDLAGRMDLRDVQMVTIDGEDAKDLDDAVSLIKENGLYRLGVHIADVSNYVQENSAMDREALKRGTSVYLVDRVIPMLPHRLSNGICSLNQGVDRLAISCLMRIDDKGNVIDYQLAETVIRVDRRMTYTNVKKILEEEDDGLCKEYEDFLPMFGLMRELAVILREKRSKRGSIDFDFPESKIILDEQGKPTAIKPYERNTATRIIEEFMLIANETVAEHFYWMEVPFLYRTHEKPDQEKVRQLAAFLRGFGYQLRTGREEIHPKELQKLLARIDGTPEEMLISRLTLRSMKQARYTVECTGHFGLACKHYCHFTSPIRRYPDLQIHRIIKEQLRGRLGEERILYYQNRLPDVAVQTSKRERRADEAERETNKIKKAEYMESHIGEIYEGVICGVTGWGIYVELQNTVEGMVHVAKLPGDYYYYDEHAYEMAGQDTGRRYRLGQRIRVCVDEVDRLIGRVDFSIPEEGENNV